MNINLFIYMIAGANIIRVVSPQASKSLSGLGSSSFDEELGSFFGRFESSA